MHNSYYSIESQNDTSGRWGRNEIIDGQGIEQVRVSVAYRAWESIFSSMEGCCLFL